MGKVILFPTIDPSLCSKNKPQVLLGNICLHYSPNLKHELLLHLLSTDTKYMLYRVLSFYVQATEPLPDLSSVSLEEATKDINVFQQINLLLSYPLFHLGTSPITPRKIMIAIFALWFFNFLAHWIEKLIHRTLVRKDFDPGAKGAIERFTRYGIFAVGLIMTLSYLGINLSSLETIGAALTVGLGFGLQNITQNFISGLILLTERPIKRGDLVIVEGTTGRVLDIRARSTLVLTRDDVVIVVPNSQFIAQQVVNQSFSGDKIRYNIHVGVAYGSDVERVKQTLLTIARNHPKVLQSPPPDVIFDDFGDSALKFTLRLWLSELWFYEIILSEIRFEIDKSFRDERIHIPFAQMDIHVKDMPRSGR